MHRHRIRAFVTGIGETDVPVTIFSAGQFIRYVSGVGLLSSGLGPGTTTVNAIATWGDTTGTQLLQTPVLLDSAANMTQLVTLDGQDAPRITATLATASPTAGKLTKWASSSAPWKLDATQTLNIVNEDGADSIYGVGSINGVIPSRWVLGPLSGGANESALVRWDGASGRLIKNSTVQLDSSGSFSNVLDITSLNGSLFGFQFISGVVQLTFVSTASSIVNVGTINSRDPLKWVEGPSSAVDNSVARFDGTTGKLIQGSSAMIDDAGTLSGVPAITGVSTINSIDPASWVRGPASSTANRVATYADTTGKLIQQAAVSIDASGNLTGVGTLNGGRWVKPRFGVSTTDRIATWFGSGADTIQETIATVDSSGNIGCNLINSRDPFKWVEGPGSAIATSFARFTDTTGKTVTWSNVTVDNSGNVAGVTTLNSKDPSSWVQGPASSLDNAVARFDATTGKLIQGSTVLIDDSANITGVNQLNGIFVNELVKGVIGFFHGSTGFSPGYGLPKRASSYRVGFVAFVPVTFGDTASTISLSMSSDDNNGSWGIHMPNSSAAGALGTGGSWANPGTYTNASFLFYATAVVPSGSGIYGLNLNISSSGSMTKLTGWQMWTYL